jgi:hypothetical protein
MLFTAFRPQNLKEIKKVTASESVPFLIFVFFAPQPECFSKLTQGRHPEHLNLPAPS